MSIVTRSIHGLDLNTMNDMSEQYPTLTKTELVIQALVREGRTSREIAHLLTCSVRNIENHRYRISRKLHGGRRRAHHPFNPLNLHLEFEEY